jgi:hypothetical protein
MIPKKIDVNFTLVFQINVQDLSNAQGYKILQ